ncbi:BTAD domain-containing putative transcriptional regulator [Streptomyces sp. JV185]|uniref:BTAD domain-containing putative transcriptional regulator n=1 Tax=Streptomyces sp. JV185 TaxID=858638 RepID=UPI002E76967B|nr:BTAD domain-containing putative transcriptional regulator [Streptomyces sp. JV185]MEE1769448.1 BTAD domain-containing putative transcriptional regulator [Streptomyces sp. JV185]
MSVRQAQSALLPPPSAARSGPVLQVLGPMSAQYGGRDIPLGPPRRRALLALLLIRLGRVVPTTVLVEELWREDPPRRAVATLQSHISHLRRALAPVAGPDRSAVLRYRAPGYVLELPPELVDVHQFEQLFSTGRRFLARQDPEAARDRLTRALELWRGSPYAEFVTHQPLADESTRLEQVRLTALEASAEAGLVLGRTAEVVTELEREVRQHPARERLVGHLMTALFRSGRQAEALEVYEWTRSYLVEEYGVDTTAELQQLHTALLRQELGGQRAHTVPSTELPARDSEFPRPVRTVLSGAARRVSEDSPATGKTAMRSMGKPREPDRTAAVTSMAPGLTLFEPVLPPPLIGRERELRRLVAATAGAATGRGHLACVFGSSGLGKSHLMMELVQRLRSRDGGMETVRSSCFSGEGVPRYWLWTQVLRRLSAARPDAFEAAAAPFGSLLASLLPGPQAGPGAGNGRAPDSSQSPFRIHDALCEVLFSLAAQKPLVLVLEDVHWADAVSLDLLRLLTTRRQGHSLSIVLTGWDLESWPDTSRFRVMTEVLKGPDVEILRLTGLARPDVATLVDAHAGPGVDERIIDALHRQSTGSPYFVLQMLSLLCDVRDLHDPGATDDILGLIVTCARKVLRQEFAMLPEPVLRLLRLCAVVAPDIDLDTVCRAGGSSAAIAIVESAIRYGLLAPDRQHTGRLRLTPPQAREVLVGELTEEECQRLHARYADALSSHIRLGGDPEETDRVARHAWLAKDVMPAERVLAWLLRAAENAELRLASEEREMWLRRAVGMAGSLPDGTTARDLKQRLHLELGQVLGQVRGFGDAEAEAEITRGHARDTAPQTPDDPAVLSALAMSLLVRGCYDESRRLSVLLRNIAERTDGPTARLGAAYGEGVALFVGGQLPEALKELEHGAELAERLAREGRLPGGMYRSDPRVYFRCYCVLTRWLLNDRAAATGQRRRLLRLTQYESRPWDRVQALYANAIVAAWEGDVETARTSGAEGVGLAVEHGLHYWKAMLHLPLGWALTCSGRREGISAMKNSLAELRQSRTTIRLPLHLGLLAQAQHHAGQREDAVDTLRTMVAVVEHRREYVYLNSALPATHLLHELLGPESAEAVLPE